MFRKRPPFAGLVMAAFALALTAGCAGPAPVISGAAVDHMASWLRQDVIHHCVGKKGKKDNLEIQVWNENVDDQGLYRITWNTDPAKGEDRLLAEGSLTAKKKKGNKPGVLQRKNTGNFYINKNLTLQPGERVRITITDRQGQVLPYDLVEDVVFNNECPKKSKDDKADKPPADGKRKPWQGTGPCTGDRYQNSGVRHRCQRNHGLPER